MTTEAKPFKITYGTLASPPEELHQTFEAAVGHTKEQMGETLGMLVNNEDRFADKTFEDRSPINTDWVLANFPEGRREDAQAALEAAHAAWPVWKDLPWEERVRLCRRAADLISERLFEISAVVALEVGKNRMEALGDVEETADLIRYYCDQVEANNGFIKPMARESDKYSNTSILKPYGVWVVISPFNFPFALAGGPAGAALVAGNTVVFKPASDTAWSGRKLAECFRDAGLPPGAFNFVTGGGRTVGGELVESPLVAGVTFTGSYEVGMDIYRKFGAGGKYPRPCIAEMGGKNATIISRHADLDLAAEGVMRSAFGLQGQKCSACSRIYVEAQVKDEFTRKLVERTNAIRVGDPTVRENWMGPVINKNAYRDFQRYASEGERDGKLLTGGRALTEGDLEKGYFCAPTIIDELPEDHRFFHDELFLPITVIGTVDSLHNAMSKANDSEYGLTSGFYSSDQDEVQWWLDHIEAGVLYVNRRAGATTGAWPGYQPFGGWKGSGSTGKSGGSLYYVQQYMHEQSQTLVAEGMQQPRQTIAGE